MPGASTRFNGFIYQPGEASAGMGLRDFVRSTVVLFRVSRKPSREEYFVLARIVLIGVALLGLISMVIRFVFLAVLG